MIILLKFNNTDISLLSFQRLFGGLVQISLLLCFLSFTSAQANIRLKIVTEDWPPFSLLNKDQVVVGEASQFVKQIMANSPYQYDLELYP